MHYLFLSARSVHKKSITRVAFFWYRGNFLVKSCHQQSSSRACCRLPLNTSKTPAYHQRHQSYDISNNVGANKSPRAPHLWENFLFSSRKWHFWCRRRHCVRRGPNLISVHGQFTYILSEERTRRCLFLPRTFGRGWCWWCYFLCVARERRA